MQNNPFPLIMILLLLKNRANLNLNGLNTLQIESMLDNLHTMIHTMEKISSFAQSDLASSLPDMKKMLEAVEKIPL